MKKSIALLAVLAATALTLAALKKKKANLNAPKPVVKTENHIVPKVTKPELPKLPEDSLLSGSLLESYRVQCQVMMDGYPENMHIEILHHCEFKDSNEVMSCAEILRKDGYNVEEHLDELALVASLTIQTEAQKAFDDVVKIATFTQNHDGLYQGWILDNCH